LEFLRLLRNSCREQFFDTREINAPQQARWFAALPSDHRHFIIWSESLRAGAFSIIPPKPDLPLPTVPQNIDKPVRYLNSLMVIPEMRGREVIETATSVFDPLLSYVGYVRQGNPASLKACAKMGLLDRGIHQHPQYGPIHIVWRD